MPQLTGDGHDRDSWTYRYDLLVCLVDDIVKPFVKVVHLLGNNTFSRILVYFQHIPSTLLFDRRGPYLPCFWDRVSQHTSLLANKA